MSSGDSGRSVLVVDDEASVRNLMRRWLESRGYSVAVAADAESALELLATTTAAVALCDLRMPGHDGLWLTNHVRREHPETAVIIATGLNDDSARTESLRQGVVDYLMKPFGRDRLCDAVARGLEWHRSACESRRWRERLEDEITNRRADLERVLAAHAVGSDEDLDRLLAALTDGHGEAYAHAVRVSALSKTIARELDVPAAEVATIARAGMLHDVGKLAMPVAVLRKPAPLTPEEQRLIRSYPRIGFELVANVPYLAGAAPIVRDAQERVDGRGYPRGARAADASIGARIVAVADAFDTMTRPRVFRDPVGPASACAELERCSGTQFDPAVVGAFLASGVRATAD